MNDSSGSSMNQDNNGSSSRDSQFTKPSIQEDKMLVPPNYSHGNRHHTLNHKPQELESKKRMIQTKLSQIYYKPQPQPQQPPTQLDSHIHLHTLTQQHMTRASQLSNNGTVASLILKSKQVKLPYTIHQHSSHLGSYLPQNIYVNKPYIQASRWSSASHDSEQFITIKFDRPVVARTITFGKYHKGHVCNLKEFKVYGVMDPSDDYIELLHHGLKNDSEPETFTLKHQHKNMVFPVQYIKIVPISAFGANFNYSIWYVEINGVTEDAIIQRVCSEYNHFKETEITRLCLKYFRQKNMMQVFDLLRARTGVELEHPLISDLHRHLVIESDFDAAELDIQQAYKRHLYQPFSERSTYLPVWKQKLGQGPSARGGHQMCIDIESRRIYILGGWDGQHDLSDFWSYDLDQEEWTLLSSDTQLQGGPGPRSCHKICFDPVSRSIFVLGRYVEPQSISAQPLESDFYRYYTEYNQWVKLNEHTARDGGPELIFDHQMCIDPEGETIYVFGGRTVTGDSNAQNYSGLYSYKINTHEWKLIRNDDLKYNGAPVVLKSRIGHSMLFSQSERSLYVFAGQRIKDYLSDLFKYDVDRDSVTEIVQDVSKDAGPDAGFTQRATMDEELKELYVFSGYMKNANSDLVKNSFWVYSIKHNEWQKVYQNEATHGSNEPCPRFAHQMIYDPISKAQYIFGGNPGDSQDSTKRLDDFWELRLEKPSPSSILRKSLYKIRMQKLKELCSKACEERMSENNSNLVIALEYLRDQVAPLVQHEDEIESKEFHEVCANLCLLDQLKEDEFDRDNFAAIIKSEDALYIERTRLFEGLLDYIPQEMKEPSGKITSAVKLN